MFYLLNSLISKEDSENPALHPSGIIRKTAFAGQTLTDAVDADCDKFTAPCQYERDKALSGGNQSLEVPDFWIRGGLG